MSRHFDPAKSLSEFLAKHDMTTKPSASTEKTSSPASVIAAAKSAASDLGATAIPALELRAQKVAIVRHMFRVAARLA